VKEIKSIAVLIACYNRKHQTLICLDKLFHDVSLGINELKVFLVDDGSTDGTEHAVHEKFPQVNIIKGNGDLFWNRSMHLAFSIAMDEGFDYYLWLNDDTLLERAAIDVMLQTKLQGKSDDTIVVGAICDPDTGRYSYGGARQLDRFFRPFLCEYVIPNNYPQELDVMNGNLVLIPNQAAIRLGNIDPIFEHAMGDTDYSMRARKLGIMVLLTPSYVGYCTRNKVEGSYRDKGLSVKGRLKQVFSRKGLPWRSWLAMCWRHGGLLWPIHFFWAYTKILFGRV